MTEYQRYISQRVLTDQLPVTYKLVSRHFNLHIDDSKKILYSFYESNKDNCMATYIITGILDEKKQIKLTTNLQLKDEFDSVSSVQIFSVKSNDNKISLNNTISSINDELSQIPITMANCDKWGVIKCLNEYIKESPVKKHDIVKEDTKVTKKPTLTKKDPFAITSLYKSRKKTLELDSEPLAKPKYQYVSRKQQSQPVKPKLTTKKIDSDLLLLFDDDDDDFKDESFDDVKEATPIEIESVNEEKVETPVEQDSKPLETEMETDTQDMLEEPEVDEEGYIVTKKKKPTGTTKKKLSLLTTTLTKASNNKQKKQSSLMNFFGKS